MCLCMVNISSLSREIKQMRMSRMENYSIRGLLARKSRRAVKNTMNLIGLGPVVQLPVLQMLLRCQ